MSSESHVQMAESNFNGDKNVEEAERQDPTSDLMSKVKGRGDVTDLLRALDGGCQKNLEANKVRDRKQKDREALIAQLPDGTRLANAQELNEAQQVPPNATIYIVPQGKSVSQAFFEKAAALGIFLVPPNGAPLMDVLNDNDRESIKKMLAAKNEAQQKVIPPVNPGNHPPTCLGACCREETLKRYPIGEAGFRVPPNLETDDTFINWNADELQTEIRYVLSESTVVRSLNHWFYAGVAIMMFMVLNHFLLGIDLYIGKLLYTLCLLVLFGIHYIMVIRKVVSGYRCPPELLDRDLSGHAAIITGGTDGIGSELVKQFYKQNITKVIIGTKSYILGLGELEKLKKHLIKENIDLSEWNNVVEIHRCDLSDLCSVQEFTHMIVQRQIPVHFLIMDNATLSLRNPKVGHLESNFAENYLGHFLLAKQLFGSIRECHGRVLITTSQLYVLAKSLDIHRDFILTADGLPTGSEIPTANIDKIKAYWKSKAALILFTKMLSQRLQVTTGDASKVFVYSPGLVDDKFVNDFCSQTWYGRLLKYFFKPFLKTQWEGAQTAFLLLLASVENLNGGGYYNEGVFYKTRGSCNLDYPQVKTNIVKLWNSSNLMVHDHSFSAKQRVAPATINTGAPPKTAATPDTSTTPKTTSEADTVIGAGAGSNASIGADAGGAGAGAG